MLIQVLTGDLTFTSLKPLDLSVCNKKDLLDYFENTYSLNESIFTGLKEEGAFYKCPDRLRLPLIFYYGHTACVYINKLILAGLLTPKDRVNLAFETMFETGVDEMSWDDTENYRMGGKFEWPKLADVVEYRRTVRNLIRKVIEDTPLACPIDMDSPWWGLLMGVEHERIHLETSSVLIRQLPRELLIKPDGWSYGPIKCGSPAGKNDMVTQNEADVTLGKPYDFPSFGWDNEYGQFKSKVPAFEASKYLITNGEYLQFVKAGGYENPELWSEEGWNWVTYRQAKHPTFWVCTNGCKSGCGADLATYSHCHADTDDVINDSSHLHHHDDVHQGLKVNGTVQNDDELSEVVELQGHQGMDEDGGLEFGFRLRCMYSVIAMPWEWPVEVNYLEAKAYCAWRGADYRLPAEAEHFLMRGPQKPAREGTSCDIIYQEKIDANLNLAYGSSTPVNMYSPTEAGFYDVAGNVWEWMEDHFNGLPGYTSSYLYDDFSAPCFDGRHTMILGGSWISTGDEASRFARFAFRRHFFQHAGFRVVRNVVPEGDKVALPVRICSSKVYVTGSGVQDNQVDLDTSRLEYHPVETTFSQYLFEKDELLCDTLRFEYASARSFPLSLAEYVKGAVSRYQCSTDSALHMGCGTGRATFKLTELFDKVLGQDFCARFIETCQALLRGTPVEFEEFDGFKKNQFVASVPEGTNADRIVFKQLTWLPNEVESHDLILLSFLDRVQNPKAWLVRLPEVVRPSGLVVVASAGHWDADALKPQMRKHFDLLENEALPFAKDTPAARVSVWKRK